MKNLNDLKIKVYIFNLNRKQFFLIYGLLFIFILFLLIFSIVFPLKNGSDDWSVWFSKYQTIIWLVSIIWLVIEAQFFWNKFTRKQLQIIENQKEIILEKNEELKQQNEEIAAQRDEILAQNDEILLQRDIVLKQKKEITDSIIYANRIQQAIFPVEDIVSQNYIELFIIFKPRNIVSGDFYWYKQNKNILYLTAADCTGHGVPGAFLSILGVSLLNEIIGKSTEFQPDVILNELRIRIKKSLHQSGKKGQTQDGMDIAFCSLNLDTLELQYAGANNPLWLISKINLSVEEKNETENNETENNLLEFKADRMPIGTYPKEQPFTNHQIQLKKSDRFYIFSDGYQSQFGGEKNEKLKSKRFQEIISKHCNKPFPNQKIEIENEFENWRGEIEQVDDVLVIGVKL